MIETFAKIMLVLTALYFIALGLLCLFAPTRAKRFLLAHASSAGKHYLELSLRLLVGFAFIVQAADLYFGKAFLVFGWILIGSTACLLLIPWQWHRRFAETMVPRATDHIALIGLSSLALGALILIVLSL